MATVTFIPYKHQAASTLGNVSAYVKQEQKTMQESGAQLVSGQNCSPQFSEQEFRIYYRDIGLLDTLPENDSVAKESAEVVTMMIPQVKSEPAQA